MGRKRALGKLPDLKDVRSAMTNALSHFKISHTDIDLMVKAVKHLYDRRLAERREEQKAYPQQPIILVEGVARFKANAIVRHLLDSHPTVDMNTLGRLKFSREDQEQFAQLIGYSVSGFGDLSYASPEAVVAADEEARKLTKGK